MKIADGEVAIFRNFKSLNLLNLLRLQSEILTLEFALDEHRHKDDKSSEKIPLHREGEEEFEVPRGDLSKAFWYMKLASDKDCVNNQQYLYILELGNKLKEYSATSSLSVALSPAANVFNLTDDLLVQFAQLNKISKPSQSELFCLLKWLDEHPFIPTPSAEKNPYDRDPDDYVYLTPEDNETNIIPDPIFKLYDRYIQRTMPVRVFL